MLDLVKKTLHTSDMHFPQLNRMESTLPIFDTLDTSGFVNIFLSCDGNIGKQRELAQTLVSREPNSLSGQAASRWLLFSSSRLA